MTMQMRAAKYTHITASLTDQSIESDESITVFGIQVSGTSAGEVIVEEADGSTVITRISVVANGSNTFDVCFLAQNGVNITTPAGVTATVFHSQGGA
jgi:hypothetical protein